MAIVDSNALPNELLAAAERRTQERLDIHRRALETTTLRQEGIPGLERTSSVPLCRSLSTLLRPRTSSRATAGVPAATFFPQPMPPSVLSSCRYSNTLTESGSK